MPNKKIGLDIADNSIEVVELTQKQKSFAISKLNRIVLKSDIVQRGRIKDEAKLKEALQKLFKEAKPNPIKNRDIIFALPESQVYTYVFKLEVHNKKDRDDLIKEEIERTIPLDLSEIFFDYKVLSDNKDGVEILLAAASIKVIKEWWKFFDKLDLKIKLFDIETLALFRGLGLKKEELPICIIDIGSASSNITIFDQNGLKYVYSLGLAGNHWDEKIAQALDIDLTQAEKKKKIIKISGKTKASQVLIKEIDSLVLEIKKSLDYYQIKSKKKINNLILLGGSSQIKGLGEYLNKVFKKDNFKISLGRANLKKLAPIEYIGAIGMAIKGLDKNYYKKDLHFDLDEVQKVYKENLTKILKNKKNKKTKKIKQIEIQESENSKSKSKVITLIVILIVGIVLIAGAFWYKNMQDQKKKAFLKETQEKLLELPTISTPEDLIQEEASISTSTENLENITTTATTTEDITKEEYVVVDNNPSGWLNVRSGPGTDYEILTKVFPEEEYVIIKKEDNWYQLKLESDGFEAGWVSASYVSLIKE